MKDKFLAGPAILVLALVSVFSVSALAQTTDDGTGPTEQPSAPMEVGTPQPPSQTQPNGDEAQPTEAQPGGPSGEAPAKTDQGVGRVSLIHGDVSTQRGDSGEWSAATLNQPVMTGDKVSTGDNARTEVQLDFANFLRLGANTKVNIANLTHKNIQVQVAQGLINYTVSKDSEAEPEIDTPNVAIHPAHHDGVFRIEIQPDGDTTLIVRKGEAQIATPQGSTVVQSGEMATIRGDVNSAQYKISDAPERDDWDRWNADRDHMIENAQSWRHTNRYYQGAQDLDSYGNWENVPDYGDVWVPNEPQGWAPYRDGNWVYEPYYGWTWVGYEPWGWAPYHYGRWMWYGNSWAWWPGPVWGWYRPFWAPAYVSFWGWGGGFGFGFGFGGWGGFGWLPLGPGDWFHPWWGGYGGRFGWVGRGWYGGRWGGFAPLHAGTRFSNVANIHNAHIGGAMSVVGAGRFGAGRVGAVAATHAQLGGAHMMAGNLPVVPSRASLSASGRAAAPSTVRNGGNERFFGTHNASVRTASFNQETENLRQNMASNHVNGFSAGGRSEGENAGRGGFNSAGKPSAGVAGGREGGRETNIGREANSNGFGRNESSSASQRASQGSNRSGYRPFTPPNSSNTRSAANSGTSRSFENRSFNNESRGYSSAGSSASREGFRSFTPPSQSEASRGASNAGERGSSGSYWNRTGPSSMSSSRGYSDAYGRGSYSNGSSRMGSSRPTLDMRQPIVRGPSYGGSRGYSAPSRGYGYPGGSRSAPSYGGSHGGYGGGGHVSAPHGYSDGGHSGGGGGHSGGGGHGGGGHR
ncbi:MAG TPA: DUF6600 domain-containing protein [Verrucomicrobiae bacterium]|nr:DUF6600 domain-containing protein [Verrucomicrobiae bacterium]